MAITDTFSSRGALAPASAAAGGLEFGEQGLRIVRRGGREQSGIGRIGDGDGAYAQVLAQRRTIDIRIKPHGNTKLAIKVTSDLSI